MPRSARKESKSGIYHVMLRGINGINIFEEDNDRIYFINLLVKEKQVSEIKIFAYCLMNNHIHLLIKEENDKISKSIGRIVANYAYWFNQKYERYGHLFQDRFKSECVEDERYFFTVLGYILRNPQSSNLIDDAKQYLWSSYKEYIENPVITDVDFALDILSNNRKSAIENLIKLTEQDKKDIKLDYEKRRRSDSEAGLLIKKILGNIKSNELCRIPYNQRNEIILKLKAKGISVRQIIRHTGISKGIVESIK